MKLKIVILKKIYRCIFSRYCVSKIFLNGCLTLQRILSFEIFGKQKHASLEDFPTANKRFKIGLLLKKLWAFHIFKLSYGNSYLFKILRIDVQFTPNLILSEGGITLVKLHKFSPHVSIAQYL